MTEKRNLKKNMTLDIVLIGVFAALISACSFITIPGPVPFTLQVFGVFCALGMLGGRNGTVAILIYILLGALGVPVFAGFKSGFGVLMGPTGGYIIGFLFSGLLYWLITGALKKHYDGKFWLMLIAMIASVLLLYVFGTAWFVIVYSKLKGVIKISKALSLCVLPFIPWDLLKITAAASLSKIVLDRIKKIKA